MPPSGFYLVSCHTPFMLLSRWREGYRVSVWGTLRVLGKFCTTMCLSCSGSGRLCCMHVDVEAGGWWLEQGGNPGRELCFTTTYRRLDGLSLFRTWLFVSFVSCVLPKRAWEGLLRPRWDDRRTAAGVLHLWLPHRSKGEDGAAGVESRTMRCVACQRCRCHLGG